MKNYIEEFLKDNGLEVGEKFKATGSDGIKRDCSVIINDYNDEYLEFRVAGMLRHYVDTMTFALEILNGLVEIEKIPFHPKHDDNYYYINFKVVVGCVVGSDHWKGVSSDWGRYHMGNCFKTEKEAIKNKDKIIEKFKF